MTTETPCTPNYSHRKSKDLEELMISRSDVENPDSYETTPSSTSRKRPRRIYIYSEDENEIDNIDRKTSDENDTISSSTELARACSSSKKKTHFLYSSDSEDSGEETLGLTPGFSALNRRGAAVGRAKKNLNKAFGENKAEEEIAKITDSSDSEGDRSTSDSNSGNNGTVHSSVKKRRLRTKRTCGNVSSPEYYGTASAEKAKKDWKMALEALKKKREQRAGRHSAQTSLNNDYDNEGPVSPKLSKNKLIHVDITIERDQKEAEEEEEEEEEEDDDDNDDDFDFDYDDDNDSGSDLGSFIIEDSQSQELDVTPFKKLSQEQCFEGYIQMILSGVVNDEFLSSLKEDKVPYFEEAKATIEGLIQTKKNAVKGKWKQFKKMLEVCTFIESIPLPETIKNAKCEACNLIRHLSEKMVFYDEQNGVKLTPPVKEFTIGCFCAEKGHIYHELHHLDFEWKENCVEKISQLKALIPGVQDDAEIVEYCMSDEEWLEDLYGRFQSLLGLADDYGPGGKKRRYMKQYCSGFSPED